MKKDKIRSFRLRWGALVYVFILALVVFFSQMLRSSVTNMLVWFVLIVPVLSAVYAMICRACVQVYVSCDTSKTEKETPLEYEIRIINSSFVPCPFLEAQISEPSALVAGCTPRRVALSLVSFGGYIVKNTVSFKYRGYFEIGVDSIYVRDLLGMFEFGLSVKNFVGVSVAPRRMKTVDSFENSVSDTPKPSSRRFAVSERVEASDIRDYVPGDPVKDIHWKLSSKTEEIKIREFSSNERNHVYILCDMAGATPVPEADSSDVYDSLKKAVLEQKKERKNKIKIRKREESISDVSAPKVSFFGDLKASFFERRRRAKRKKNLKSGMDEKTVEMADMIEGLIRASSKSELKRRLKEKERSEDKAKREEIERETAAKESALLEGDLDRVFTAIDAKLPETDTMARAYGGRVKGEFLENFDELCADAICEIALSAAIKEINNGGRCTLLWLDPREEGGVAAYDASTGADFELAASRLAGAKCVPHDNYVSSLTGSIHENSDVTVKVVTSNISPVSLGEIMQVPDSFGGAGTGCVCEVLLFSPDERYEKPAARRAYIDETVSQLLRRGIKMTQLSERIDTNGEPCFEAVLR